MYQRNNSRVVSESIFEFDGSGRAGGPQDRCRGGEPSTLSFHNRDSRSQLRRTLQSRIARRCDSRFPDYRRSERLLRSRLRSSRLHARRSSRRRQVRDALSITGNPLLNFDRSGRMQDLVRRRSRVGIPVGRGRASTQHDPSRLLRSGARSSRVFFSLDFANSVRKW